METDDGIVNYISIYAHSPDYKLCDNDRIRLAAARIAGYSHLMIDTDPSNFRNISGTKGEDGKWERIPKEILPPIEPLED